MRIFLAGAAGVVGRRLVPLLVGAGHQVTGTTRSPEKAAELARAGAAAAVVDVFDAPALTRAVVAAKPDVVIHQLTDLPDVFDRDTMAAAAKHNSRIRIEGTANLVAAALAAGARRMVAQSIAFIYAPGPEPHQESDALMSDREGEGAVTARGVLALERLVTTTPGLDGIVLRYGRFYGPGTLGAPTRRPWLLLPRRCRRPCGACSAISAGAAGILQHRRGRRRGVDRQGAARMGASTRGSGSGRRLEGGRRRMPPQLIASASGCVNFTAGRDFTSCSRHADHGGLAAAIGLRLVGTFDAIASPGFRRGTMLRPNIRAACSMHARHSR